MFILINNNVLLKNRYYKGKLLRTEDFICEQEYHSNSLKRFLKNYVGSGIVDGLQVTKKDNQRILISKGSGIDDAGTWIHLPKDKDVVIEEIIGFETLEQNEAWLCICYQEIESNKMFAAISNDDNQEEYNYIQESCMISLQGYHSPKRVTDYHDISIIYEDSSIKITQWIPKYISEYQSFSIKVIVENLTNDSHKVSFSYTLQSVEIIDKQKKDVITIKGTCLLEQEKEFSYLVKKNPQHGSLQYAHFTLLHTNAKVCIDGTIFAITNTYQKALPIIKDMTKHLLTILHQSKNKQTLLVDNQYVPIAYLRLDYSNNKTSIVSVDQTKVNYITTTKTMKMVDDILDMYDISNQVSMPIPSVDPSDIPVIPAGIQVHSDVIKIEVPGYKRNQLPILTKEISYTLDGVIYMSWAMEKKSSIYQENHQAKEQYFGAISLFSNNEDYEYDIACKVIESRQTFKFAIRACKGTPSRTVSLRYYAIGFDETNPKQPDIPMQVIPEFIIVKPGEQTYFSIVFEDASKEEVCDFEVEPKNGGNILENGLYTAPTVCGVYKIIITGRISKCSVQAAVVVKEDS